MTTPSFTIPLAMVLIVAALLGAMADQTINTAGNTVLGSTAEQADINALLDFKLFNIKEISLFQVSVSIPMINVAFFSGLFDLLTWNFSYFKGTWAILRLFFMSLTFSVGIMVLISIAPILIGVAEFLGRAAAGVVGIFGAGARALLSFR